MMQADKFMALTRRCGTGRLRRKHHFSSAALVRLRLRCSVGQTIVFGGLLFRACGPRNFMKNGFSGRMGRWCGEVDQAVEKSRLFVCLIRSMRV